MLWNRLIWLSVGAVFLGFACYRFSFAERRQKTRRHKQEELPEAASVALPVVYAHVGSWQMYWSSVKIHLSGILTNIVFIVILLAGLMNCVPAIIFNAREGYGNSTLPVTYWVLEIINGTFYLFLIVLITYYAGVLIWKDRDTRMDEIADSLPTPEWVAYTARFTALCAMMMILQALVLLSGIIVQASYGYHRFQLGLYLWQLFVHDLSFFVFLAALAFFIHVFSPNKYVGYFAYIAFLIVNLFIWTPLNVSTNLVQFSSVPNVTYSDFFGDAPYMSGWRWFTLYWLFFCGLLAIASVMFWPRGKQLRLSERWRLAQLRFSRPWATTTVVCLALFAATGGWTFYNIKILNRLIGPKDQLRLQADYEKTYKQFAYKEFPRIRSDRYWVDIDPETRNVTIRIRSMKFTTPPTCNMTSTYRFRGPRWRRTTPG